MAIKNKIIDKIPVAVTQFPGIYANRLFTTVLKYFGSGIVQVIGQITHLSSLPKAKDGKISILDMDLNWGEVSGIISDFSNKLTPDEWSDFCLKTFAYTDVNGKRVSDEAAFNDAFTGKILFMCKVLVFTLEANYGDFFEASGIGNTPTPPVTTPIVKK